MAKVTWSPQSVEDIAHIAEFYFKTSSNYAENLISSIFSKEELISTFPEIGRIVPELNNKSVREIIFKNYRIIYSIFDENRISVLTVHTSSKPLTDISLFD
ncbi:addiction module toxin, RelE/StbE family [Belliella baltica DSM 15883]|uniref:Addiction module toxin, RelE/StbE family n=1 Tax=Belliella baltica (strain DSM 15883 / CIP 108006 / LMG 21964 / BA134) TaxID=866536 RepID=I3Z5C3_BELBD|nr:type II toxin-antitoxin system RelE/ParE family toxin [Belliella baltica]AFL84441.1 addiction module toxin, RelE/StbE family [Belliella baltica DSM 15883]